MADSHPERTMARVGMMRSHLGRATEALDELKYREIAGSTDHTRIAELKGEVAFALGQTFRIAAAVGLFRPVTPGAGLAPPPAAAPEPDNVYPFPPPVPPFVTAGEALQPTMSDVEALLSLQPEGVVS